MSPPLPPRNPHARGHAGIWLGARVPQPSQVACSDSLSKGECTHPQFVCTIKWHIPAFGRFRSFFRHLSERDNSYSIQCANVGRLLATFLSSAFSSCCRAASRAPTAIITGGLLWWDLATNSTQQRRNHPPNQTVSLSRHHSTCLPSHP